jgi:hypothetical protein
MFHDGWEERIRCKCLVQLVVFSAHKGLDGMSGDNSCCAPLGIGTYVAGTMGDATMPGVLLRVTRWWTRGVSFNFRFAVGLQASMMPGTFVILGMVIIGELSITLCCATCSTWCNSSLTLCPFKVGGGASNAVIQSLRSWRIRHPFGVVLTRSVLAVSSSVRAQKC